jgi:uncharacterized glyoxalase superfamily protein PhnB
MPAGTIIPELAYPDVHEAAEWLCRTFGFVERLRIGSHRIQLSFGSGSVVVTHQAAAPETTGSRRDHSIMVRVADVDGHYERTQRARAQIVNPPADYPFGERQYTAEDFSGRRWTFSQTIADIDPATWGGELRG